MKGSLINPLTNKIWDDDSKLQEMLAETNEFYTPYAKTRLDLYFEHREMLFPNSPSNLHWTNINWKNLIKNDDLKFLYKTINYYNHK